MPAPHPFRLTAALLLPISMLTAGAHAQAAAEVIALEEENEEAAPLLSPRAIELVNGDVISGNLVEETDESITLDSPALGQITVSRDDIEDDNVDPPTPPTEFDRYFDNIAESIDSVLFPGWEKSFSAGFTGSEGNSETLSIYADFATGYEDDNDRWAINANYFRGTDSGEVIQNQINASLTKDWLIPGERHFYWANVVYQFDQLTSFESRIGAYFGVGYEIWEGPVHTLLGRVGAGGSYEFGDVNEFTPELFVGLDYAWKINGNMGITAFTYFYPAADPFLGSYRNISGAALKLKLAAADGLAFKVGARHEYRSVVQDGDDSADLNYFAALTFDF